MSGGDNSQKHKWILEAETRGLIEREQGRGRTMRCGLTPAGMQLHQRKIAVVNREGQ
jgi:hypothetical protein